MWPDVAGVLHFVERVLDGFGKIAGVPGDGGGVTGPARVSSQAMISARAFTPKRERRQLSRLAARPGSGGSSFLHNSSLTLHPELSVD